MDIKDLGVSRPFDVNLDRQDCASRAFGRARVMQAHLHNISSSATWTFGSAEEDEMLELGNMTLADRSLDKVNLGAGVYRNDLGKYHHLEVLTRAKAVHAESCSDHDYLSTFGLTAFVKEAAALVLTRARCEILSEHIASIQTIAGTGANHLAASLLGRVKHNGQRSFSDVYIPNLSWTNHRPLFEQCGYTVREYPYYDCTTNKIDFEGLQQFLTKLSPYQVIVFQACGHNPSATDPTLSQWKIIAQLLKLGGHTAILDTAYQGFARDLTSDSWVIGHFADIGIDLFIAQSFSKNLGLYSERLGCLHYVSTDRKVVAAVRDHMRAITRAEVSSCPAYPAQLALIVMTHFRDEWESELATLVERLKENRRTLIGLLEASGVYRLSHIVQQSGMFAYTGLTFAEVIELRKRHIYLPSNGRINVAGLNHRNLELVANSLLQLLRTDMQ